jgi:RNA polymerase sigma factor (sigma-70 family)
VFRADPKWGVSEDRPAHRGQIAGVPDVTTVKAVTLGACASYISDVGVYGPSVPDAELLGRADHDPVAFEQFYRRHFATVTRFLARRCATPEDVADATSATFLAVLLSSSTYRPSQGQPVGWLCSVAANEAKRLHRKNYRNAALAERVRGSRFLASDDAERLAEMIDAEKEAATVQIFITEAPPGERELIQHMVADDLSATEAARAIGISSGAGRVRLSRLRSRLTRAQNAVLSHEASRQPTGQLGGNR